MEESFERIYRTLKEFKQYSENIDNFDRNHIFFDILKHISIKSNSNEKITIFYLFNYYQKSLEEARINNLNSSYFWLKEAEKINKSLSPDLKKGMDSLYYPMIAFNDYVTKDYDKAIYNLNFGIKIQTELEKNGLDAMLLAKVEQVLNIGRVYISKGDFLKMNNVISELLRFLLHGETSKYFDVNSRKNLENLDEKELTSIINYILKSILNKILITKDRLSINTDEYTNKLIISLASNNPKNVFSKQINTIIDLINTSELGDKNDFLEKLDYFLLDLTTAPNILQYIIIEKFKHCFPESLFYKDFEKIIIEYYTQFLKIEHSILPKKII